MKLKELTCQVVLDALALTTCYPAFLITVKVPVIYMHQFWATINKHKASYRLKIDNKRFSINVEVFKEILNICPKVSGKAFVEPPTEEEALSFIRELGHTGEINLLGTMRFVSRHADTQVYGAILPQAMTNQALLDSVAYKTYYTIASGAEPPKSRKSQKKSESAISSKESPSKNDEEDDDDDEDDFEDVSGDNNDDNDNDDDNDDVNVDDSDDERTELDIDEIPDLDQTNKEQAEEEAKYDDERVYTPDDYELTNEEKIDDEEKYGYADMTHDDQGGAEEHNVSQKLGLMQEEEDAHVTLTMIHDIQKTEGPLQTSSLYTIPITTILEVTTTIPPPPPFFNPLQHTNSNTNSFRNNNLISCTSRLLIQSLEVIVLAKSSYQPKITYEAAASLSEFELTKILIDMMEENKSHLRGRDDKDKDQDPSTGSDRGTNRRNSSKEVESSKDLRSKEEFDTGNNDEQHDEKVAPGRDWYKRQEQPPTLDLDWVKRQRVDIYPPQTWISNAAHAEHPPTLFDELNDSSFDFFAFILN
uniref:Uncharacterized protein n=1 Tax=Tanacetum cinerariifolium TaxID=118510 RepID=A0A6L2JHV2_TANCI|nr:hypothetical protein [Tanacetum cinerariifolium]